MTQLNEQFRRMQVLAGLVTEGFLDDIAANIKGKSEQGKLAQEFLNKVGILKNPSEIFSLGMEGGGQGPFENEVQDYLFSGGDINTKIPFSKNIKSSSGGAIFKETYTFDFNKDIPTIKSGGKFIWDIKGGKWESFDKDGNEGKEEPIDIESMKREDDAEPGTFATEASMMTIADVAKIWPDSHPGTPYGYGKRVLDIVKFMEGKKINKMTPEDVKEFENKDKSDTSNQPQPQAESLNQLNEQYLRMQKLAGLITESQLNESIVTLDESLNEEKLNMSHLPLDFIFKYPDPGTTKPGNLQDWIRDGMKLYGDGDGRKLEIGRIEKFSPVDDAKLKSLIKIWWEEYDDVSTADFNSGRDSEEIKKVKKDILDFLMEKSKVNLQYSVNKL